MVLCAECGNKCAKKTGEDVYPHREDLAHLVIKSYSVSLEKTNMNITITKAQKKAISQKLAKNSRQKNLMPPKVKVLLGSKTKRQELIRMAEQMLQSSK